MLVAMMEFEQLPQPLEIHRFTGDLIRKHIEGHRHQPAQGVSHSDLLGRTLKPRVAMIIALYHWSFRVVSFLRTLPILYMFIYCSYCI